MQFLESNKEALEKHQPILYHKLSQRNESVGDVSDQYVIETAKNGTEIFGVVCNDRKIMLNSTYSPEKEADRFAGKIQFTDHSITVFCGMGNGIMLSAVVDRLDKESSLIVYEPSFSLFCYVIEHFDMTDLFSDERITFFVEGLNDDILGNYLTSILNSMNIGVTVLEYHPKYRELYPDSCTKIEGMFQECRESELTNLNTIIDKSGIMVKNAVMNLRYMFRSKSAFDFIGKLPADIPVIIVSGGPSLDQNYKVLEQAKGKSLIIAVDRTARYLLDRGIVPDLFCSLDFNKNPELFRDERLREIPFLYIPDLSNYVLDIVDSHQLIYGGSDYKIYDQILQQCGRDEVLIPYGGSVATFAFSFARYIGAKRVILIGQDLALTSGKTYAGNLKNGRAEMEELDRLMVPGNVEEMVETRGDFYIYLLWFKQAVKEAEGYMEVINATEAGARIDGTKIMKFQDAVDQYCTNEYCVQDVFAEVDYVIDPDARMDIYHLLQMQGKELVKLKDVIKKARGNADRCLTLVNRGNIGKELKKLNRELAVWAKMFDEGIAANLVERYMDHLLLQDNIDLYVTEDDDKEEMLRLYQKLQRDYTVMFDHIDELIDLYQSTLVKIRDEYQLG